MIYKRSIAKAMLLNYTEISKIFINKFFLREVKFITQNINNNGICPTSWKVSDKLTKITGC